MKEPWYFEVDEHWTIVEEIETRLEDRKLSSARRKKLEERRDQT